MAGDWIKMRTRLAEERATMVICDLTGLDEFAVVGRLHAIWAWAGEHTITGEVRGVTLKTVDRVTRCENFGEAMKAANWLEVQPDGGIKFPRWKLHNSKAAKERALASVRSAKARRKKRDAKRDVDRDATVTNHGTRGEERRGEGEAEKSIQSGKAPIGADRPPGQSPPVDRSRVNNSLPGEKAKARTKRPENPIDLAGLDWEAVCQTAAAVAKRVPARTPQDRRAWFRYSVMAHQQFSENWIIDAAEAAARNELNGNRQAYFVAALKSKAAEHDEDCTAEVFNGIAERIEIPARVWNTQIIPVEARK